MIYGGKLNTRHQFKSINTSKVFLWYLRAVLFRGGACWQQSNVATTLFFSIPVKEFEQERSCVYVAGGSGCIWGVTADFQHVYFIFFLFYFLLIFPTSSNSLHARRYIWTYRFWYRPWTNSMWGIWALRWPWRTWSSSSARGSFPWPTRSCSNPAMPSWTSPTRTGRLKPSRLYPVSAFFTSLKVAVLYIYIPWTDTVKDFLGKEKKK